MKHWILHLKESFPELGENGKDPTLEVCLPETMTEMGRENEKRPCMVVLPGGAYRFCSEREADPIGSFFYAGGFNVFILRYSVAPHRFPAALCETAAAVELIVRNREEWHCDTDKIAMIGFSAGGHLAAHYANAYDHPLVRRLFPESRGVNACLLCYPVITADLTDGHQESFENLAGHAPITEKEREEFSCENMVSSRTPPTFLWNTFSDELVPVYNTLRYAEKLGRCGVPFELHVFPWGEHGLATADRLTCDDLTPERARNHMWMDCAMSWLENVFAGKASAD